MRQNTQLENVEQFLGATQKLIQNQDGENKPLYVQFCYESSPKQIQTDESEVIFAFENGFGVVAQSGVLPNNWRISSPDPEGNALFKVPKEACVGYQHRNFRRRRYHANVRCRQYLD